MRCLLTPVGMCVALVMNTPPPMSTSVRERSPFDEQRGRDHEQRERNRLAESTGSTSVLLTYNLRSIYFTGLALTAPAIDTNVETESAVLK